MLSFFIAFIQESLSLSKEIPTISNSLEEYLFLSLTKSGFSILQGPHHDAQKSSKIILDFTFEREIDSPSSPGPSKSGAVEPNDIAFLDSMTSFILFLISLEDFVFLIMSVNLEK